MKMKTCKICEGRKFEDRRCSFCGAIEYLGEILNRAGRSMARAHGVRVGRYSAISYRSVSASILNHVKPRLVKVTGKD